MQTSRDDFVIAIRSAFLKKGTKQSFSLLSLIFFSIIFLILGGLNFKAINYIKISIKDVVYRSSYLISVPEKLIKKNYLAIQNYLNIYEKYEINKIELENIKSQNILNKFIILENQRLKKIVDDYLIENDQVIAKVLSDKQSPFLKSIIVNKGSKHNIQLGMAVLDNNYLVGKVIEVNYLSSRVLLLNDLNSKIPVIIEPGSIQSILSGTGKNVGIIQYLKKESKITNSAIIYTSGTAGLFKAGIPVGKIVNNDIDNKKEVTFFSDFLQLSFVKIASYKDVEIK